MPRRQKRKPSIGFCSCSALTRASTFARAAIRRIVLAVAHAQLGRLDEQLFERRQELVQRRVEQPNRHRVTGHRCKDAGEIVALERQQPRERGFARLARIGHDHLLHDRQAVRAP